MDSIAEFLAEAIRCERKAATFGSRAARELLLSTAARWRVLAEAAAEREVAAAYPSLARTSAADPPAHKRH